MKCRWLYTDVLCKYVDIYKSISISINIYIYMFVCLFKIHTVGNYEVFDSLSTLLLGAFW